VTNQHHQGVEARPIIVRQTSGMAIAAMVLGIVGFSLLAVIFGHVALGDVKRNRKDGRGMAIAGLVLGYLGVIFWVILIVAMVATVNELPDSYPDLTDYCATYPEDC